MKGVEALRARIQGQVILPEDPGYDRAREIYNAMHDRRPAVVVQPSSSDDIATTVRFARSAELPLAVRGGGHSLPGFSSCDDGVMLDLRNLATVSVDGGRRVARVGGGCTWGRLNDAAHESGLATPGGVISTTGVAGLTLGGGIGFLSRAYGLACDNVSGAEVVTADGSVVRCDAKSNPDLYWGIRGGGGNFGVVASLDFRLHSVRDIVGGPTFFPVERGVIEGFGELMADAPRDLGVLFGLTRAPALPFVPEPWHGEPVAALLVCWTGPPEEAEDVLAPMRKWGHILGQNVGPMPYPVINTLFDELLPFGLRHYWKSLVADSVPGEAITAHVEHAFTVPTVESGVFFHPIDGACHDVAAGDSAFPHRDARFVVGIYGSWHEPAEDEANRAWVRRCYEALRPHYFNSEYVNFASQEDTAAVRSIYGDNYDRLVEVKRRWDPDNVLRLNQNIPPAPS